MLCDTQTCCVVAGFLEIQTTTPGLLYRSYVGFNQETLFSCNFSEYPPSSALHAECVVSLMHLGHMVSFAGTFLLAICEGNFCKGGRKGRQAGNGRIIVSQLHVNASDPSDCRYVNCPCIVDFSGQMHILSGLELLLRLSCKSTAHNSQRCFELQ